VLETVELQEAAEADYPAVIAMTNRAYRQPTGQADWKVETLVEGQRIDESLLRDDLAQPGARLLIWRDAAGAHMGHVRLDDEGHGTWYLAMLTVRPDRQDGGLGRTLLAAAEDYARKRGGRRMRMTVVQQRAELIAWYQRRGYELTGETRPFPYGDDRFGIPTRDDLAFVVLERAI
jgi:ribosomal protein S18 acetylase RimI-like enzyme